jgi:hypothetical protein
MAADENGNDLKAVSIPLTGFAAVDFAGTAGFLAPEVGGTWPLILPTGYEKLGLFKVDGGPQDSSETEDAIEFFQDGYKMAGASTMTVQVNLAQFDANVRRLTTGKTPDANGMIVVTQATPDNTFPFVTVTAFKNGAKLVRSGMSRVSAVERDQETRGEVNGRATTFEWVYDETIGGYYREWLIVGSSEG